MALTDAEREQKLLDIAWEPACGCGVAANDNPETHRPACGWRAWRERMTRYEEEDR